MHSSASSVCPDFFRFGFGYLGDTTPNLQRIAVHVCPPGDGIRLVADPVAVRVPALQLAVMVPTEYPASSLNMGQSSWGPVRLSCLSA